MGWQRILMVLAFPLGMESGKLREAVALFNEQKFFECHEVLEVLWRVEKGKDKRFYQGILQFAVALEHHKRGNVGGFFKVLQDARQSLEGYPTPYQGIKLQKLRDDLEGWWDYAIGRSKTTPGFPHIEFTQGIILG